MHCRASPRPQIPKGLTRRCLTAAVCARDLGLHMMFSVVRHNKQTSFTSLDSGCHACAQRGEHALLRGSSIARYESFNAIIK